MSLMLGKNFDRSYSVRVSMLEKNYNIGIFFNTKTSFMLFRVDPELQVNDSINGIKIQMFKNLESSKFCETFVDLHNYRKNTLDIRNQFQSVKNVLSHEINFALNETINVSKITVDDRVFYDTMTIYGLTFVNYHSEYFFLIAERQNIMKQLGKKMVRTIGIQLATSASLEFLDDYNKEIHKHELFKTQSNRKKYFDSDEKPIIQINQKG